MKISASQTDETSLASFGTEAVQLLLAGDISSLADRFGYALSFSRDASVAIREDLDTCLSELSATNLSRQTSVRVPAVRYLKPNDSGLFAVVECVAPTNNGSEVLVELLVTSKGPEKYVTLEQLSAAA